MFFKNLETNRLKLVNISIFDREFIFNQFSNEFVNKYLFDEEPLTDIIGADKIIDFYTYEEPRNQHRWILSRKLDGIKIGTCGFHCWNKSEGVVDIGYDLMEEFCGNGYMTEAVEAIINFAKSEMHVKQIDAHIYHENEKSIDLIRKFGFEFLGKTEDAIFRGEKYLHKVYSIIID